MPQVGASGRDTIPNLLIAHRSFLHNLGNSGDAPVGRAVQRPLPGRVYWQAASPTQLRPANSCLDAPCGIAFGNIDTQP